MKLLLEWMNLSVTMLMYPTKIVSITKTEYEALSRVDELISYNAHVSN